MQLECTLTPTSHSTCNSRFFSSFPFSSVRAFPAPAPPPILPFPTPSHLPCPRSRIALYFLRRVHPERTSRSAATAGVAAERDVCSTNPPRCPGSYRRIYIRPEIFHNSAQDAICSVVSATPVVASETPPPPSTLLHPPCLRVSQCVREHTPF